MNKKMYSLLLTFSLFLSANLVANNSTFGSLTRSIELSADMWINEFVSTLDIWKQAMFLNLFIPPALSSVEASINCVKSIQADPALRATSEQLEQNMQHPIELYIKNMQKKFESLQATGSKAMQNFIQKLEKKVYELIAHFYGIYYTKLYNHVAKQDPSVLYYMFDEQGLIAPEKRVRALPKPTA